jgi:hypothetical protein
VKQAALIASIAVVLFAGIPFLLLYPGFFKGPALGAMIFPGLLSLWYLYDATTKSGPYPWLAVTVLWTILWSIGFVTLFARKVGWKAGTALVKKLTARPGNAVPAVADIAAPAAPPPLEPH